MTRPIFTLIVVAVTSFLLPGNKLEAAGEIRISNQAVDHATLQVGHISSSLPIHVQLFDVAGAELGNPKHRDTAELLAKVTPHLLAVDIVESLRQSGFDKVVVDEQPAESSVSHAVLTGHFTTLNPGSQAARAWVGFGAGASKVCIEGRLTDSSGKELGRFSHCRKGLGWGNSVGQIEAGAERLGDSVAMFLVEWAEGKYARQ